MNALYLTPDMNAVQQEPFLRVPPFPGAPPTGLVGERAVGEQPRDRVVDELLRLVRELRVGGDYWAKQPVLPEESYVLVKVANKSERSQALINLPSDERVLLWIEDRSSNGAEDGPALVVTGPCDPWHLVSGASRVVVHADDELALIAAIAGIPLTCVGEGSDPSSALHEVFRERVVDRFYRDPFTGEPSSAEAAIRLCGYWRQLIDGNRDISGAVGFAFWKRPTVAPLLWGGSGDVNFIAKGMNGVAPGRIAVWKARIPSRTLEELEQANGRLIEVEDGFIRSAGLGADCVPPLSIVVDRLGVHFDPAGPSDLENLIQNGTFDAELLERARKLREVIVASGVSKYGASSASQGRRTAERVVGSASSGHSIPISGSFHIAPLSCSGL